MYLGAAQNPELRDRMRLRLVPLEDVRMLITRSSRTESMPFIPANNSFDSNEPPCLTLD